MQLKEFSELCRSNARFLILFPLILAVIVLVVTSLFVPDTYTATASIIVAGSASNEDGALSASDIAGLLSSEQIKRSAGKMLGKGDTSSIDVSVSTESGANVVGLSVTGTEADRPDEIAQALVESLTQELDRANTPDALRLVGDVNLPDDSSGPNRLLYPVFALIAGLIASTCFIVMRDALDGSVKDERILESAADASVISRIPFYKKQPNPEQFRLQLERIVANLQLVDPGHAVKCIAICSAVDGEGKTFVATSLARLLASEGRRVLLVDSGTNDEGAFATLGVKPRHSLKDAIEGLCGIKHVIVLTRTKNLSVLSCGSGTVDACSIFLSEGFRTSISQLRDAFDYVIFDTPSLIDQANGAALGHAVDAIVLLVGWRFAETGEFEMAIDQLGMAGVKPKGLVINGIGAPYHHTRHARVRKPRAAYGNAS